MEKAILKTLIYADIFDYPLTIYEIHKWLIGKKSNLRQIEKALKSLSKTSLRGPEVKKQKDYYFLPHRSKLVSKRQSRQKQAREYFKKAQLLANVLRIIPWIKLVGVSGGLAMENTQKKDDIDLFIITSKNRLWISRLLALGLLSLIKQRRKVTDQKSQVAGKLCLNILLEEDKLAQKQQDIYLAHEILQMKVLWQRAGIYYKYLTDNEWVFKFLPNWIGPTKSGNRLQKVSSGKFLTREDTIMTIVEDLARKFQLKIMGQPQGMERIKDGALYFHPNDIRPQILKEYRMKLKKLSVDLFSSGESTVHLI